MDEIVLCDLVMTYEYPACLKSGILPKTVDDKTCITIVMQRFNATRRRDFSVAVILIS